VTLTAARGQGKSAALGLAIAAALAHGYSNIFVTSPSPENLKTLFEFIFKGMDALGYEEHLEYDIAQSTNPDFNKAIVRVNIYRQHRQTIQVNPDPHSRFSPLNRRLTRTFLVYTTPRCACLGSGRVSHYRRSSSYSSSPRSESYGPISSLPCINYQRIRTHRSFLLPQTNPTTPRKHAAITNQKPQRPLQTTQLQSRHPRRKSRFIEPSRKHAPYAKSSSSLPSGILLATRSRNG
jgi:hypothetical protein